MVMVIYENFYKLLQGILGNRGGSKVGTSRDNCSNSLGIMVAVICGNTHRLLQYFLGNHGGSNM